MADDLFTPTIESAAYEVTRPPWRLASLLYPAAFGGPTAVTVLALLNAGRLGLPRAAKLAVAGAGLAALAARVAVTLALYEAGTEQAGRLIGMLAGVLVWLVASATQKARFRAFELRGGEPASLWGPGFAAAIVFGGLELLLILVLAGA